MGLRFFFSPFLRTPHNLSLLSQQLANACFKDSGAWDYCLARLFDLIARVGFIFTLVAITEHGWGERAVGFLWSSLSQFTFMPLAIAGSLNLFLSLFFKVFGGLFLLITFSFILSSF